MSRHPLGGALRVSEEPPRAAFLAGAEQLWPWMLSLQIENVGLNATHAELLKYARQFYVSRRLTTAQWNVLRSVVMSRWRRSRQRRSIRVRSTAAS